MTWSISYDMISMASCTRGLHCGRAAANHERPADSIAVDVGARRRLTGSSAAATHGKRDTKR